MAPENTTDWITAIGSAFAAVGTVGAVVVALWQTRRRDAYKVRVTCERVITGDEEIGDLVALKAVNVGERMVKLTMAYLRADDGKTVIAPFFNPEAPHGAWRASFQSEVLPETLVDGDEVAVCWKRKTLGATLEKNGLKHYLCAYFTDPLGNTYEAPYPGVKVKRTGWPWRRRTEYIPPSV
ncbi:MAG: hypothetical protein ACYCUM_14440 [Solirubrobacteraceae bacterium]